MDETRAADRRRQVRDQAHDPLGAGARPRASPTGSTSTRSTATRTSIELSLNEIGRVQLRVTQPLFVDPYLENRQTGSFILVDEGSNRTVGAGMLMRTGNLIAGRG